jgi:hypothetical protein
VADDIVFIYPDAKKHCSDDDDEQRPQAQFIVSIRLTTPEVMTAPLSIQSLLVRLVSYESLDVSYGILHRCSSIPNHIDSQSSPTVLSKVLSSISVRTSMKHATTIL